MNLKLLIDESSIKRRLKELSLEISKDYMGKLLTVIPVLKGAFVFAADLIRELKTETVVDFVRVKSYSGFERRSPELLYGPELNMKGRDVLIVDMVFDSGESLKFVYDRIASMNPSSVATCVFAVKDVEVRKVDFVPDYVGFNLPDKFVVGYGLDFNELYRDLPYIGYIEE